jgi:hypothetical protein
MVEASQSPSRSRFGEEPLAVSADVVGQAVVDQETQCAAEVSTAVAASVRPAG